MITTIVTILISKVIIIHVMFDLLFHEFTHLLCMAKMWTFFVHAFMGWNSGVLWRISTGHCENSSILSNL